jgi:hypothetical protein
VLDALRQVDDEPPRAPTPGLAGLEGLVAKATASGLLVRTELQGTPRPLPVAVDLAAFRIVQEALTNVTRHAAGATATVRVTYGERELTIQVDDDGGHAAAGPTPGGGSGISGMRERAVALGGELEAGPRPDWSQSRRSTAPSEPITGPLSCGFSCAPRGIRTPNRQIRRLVVTSMQCAYVLFVLLR